MFFTAWGNIRRPQMILRKLSNSTKETWVHIISSVTHITCSANMMMLLGLSRPPRRQISPTQRRRFAWPRPTWRSATKEIPRDRTRGLKNWQAIPRGLSLRRTAIGKRSWPRWEKKIRIVYNPTLSPGPSARAFFGSLKTGSISFLFVGAGLY